MSSSSYKTRNLEIIIGTYEEFLLGYKVELKDNKEVLVQSFADKSHSGSIRCVAVHKQWIATGGSDDRIFIYDMSNRSQTQILLCHEGSVNALTFTPDGTHLLSVADDGRFIATRLKTWLSEASWKKAHSGLPVTHVSCHPSGKLALSLGSDMVMRTWNLVKGRVAYKTNLKSHNSLGRQPDCLTWSSSGDYFTLSGPRVVEIWSIKTASVLHSYNTKSRPICICWIAAEACVVGLEDGNILWLSLNKDEEGQKFELIAHNARVKAIHSFKDYIVTASSSGEIKLWLIDETQTQSKSKLIELAATNIGCRPTCINILDLEQFGKDYSISGASDESSKQTKPINIVKKSFPKVVVTVEYDTDTKQEIHKKSIKKPSNDDDTNKSDEFEDDNKKEEKSFEEESNKEMMNYADTDTEDEDSDVDSMYSKNKRSSLHDTLENKKHKLDISKSKKIRKKKSKICRDRKQNILHSKVKKQN